MTQATLAIIAHLEQNRGFATYHKNENGIFLKNEKDNITITVSTSNHLQAAVFEIAALNVSIRDIAVLPIESISEMETILTICNRYLDKGIQKLEPVRQTLLHLDPNIALPDTTNGTKLAN